MEFLSWVLWVLIMAFVATGTIIHLQLLLKTKIENNVAETLFSELEQQLKRCWRETNKRVEKLESHKGLGGNYYINNETCKDPRVDLLLEHFKCKVVHVDAHDVVVSERENYGS